MDLSAFTNFDRNDPAQLRLFLDLNALAHDSTLQAMTTVVDHFPLFGEPTEDWALRHDREHRDIAAALSIAAPPDLSVVDFSKQTSEDWLLYHKQHHDLINQTLGI